MWNCCGATWAFTWGANAVPRPQGALQGAGCSTQGNVSQLADLSISAADDIYTFTAYRQMALVSVVLPSP